MIDIIIPLYNARKTISNTLDSVLKQVNLSDIVVYLVDDASDDDYTDIIEDYSKKMNIKYLRLKKNSGPGVARQYGIDHSNNEYIIFLDSDDEFCENDSVLALYNNILGYDIVFAKIKQCYSDHDDILFHECCLHGKMYKRSFMKSKKIKFNDLRSHEDNAFNQLYLVCSKNVRYIDDVVYKYNYNDVSITRTTDGVNSLNQYITSMNWLFKEIEKHDDIDYNYAGIVVNEVMFYTYFNYLMYEDAFSFVFERMGYIKSLYDKYNVYLEDSERIRVYNGFNYPVIPDITFFDYMDKIK